MPALNGPSQHLEHSDLLGRGRSAGTQYARGLFQAARPPDVQQTASARHAFVSAANEIGTTQSVKTARLRCGIVPFTRLPSHGEGHTLGIIARREFITLLGARAAAGDAGGWVCSSHICRNQPREPRHFPPRPGGDGYIEGKNLMIEYRWAQGIGSRRALRLKPGSALSLLAVPEKESLVSSVTRVPWGCNFGR